jgi:hypothetical protein
MNSYFVPPVRIQYDIVHILISLPQTLPMGVPSGALYPVEVPASESASTSSDSSEGAGEKAPPEGSSLGKVHWQRERESWCWWKVQRGEGTMPLRN